MSLSQGTIALLAYRFYFITTQLLIKQITLWLLSAGILKNHVMHTFLDHINHSIYCKYNVHHWTSFCGSRYHQDSNCVKRQYSQDAFCRRTYLQLFYKTDALQTFAKFT